MPTTARWAAQDRLWQIVQDVKAADSSPLARVEISLGAPGVIEHDHVWVAGEIDDWQGEYTLTTPGSTLRDERFSLRLHVFAHVIGADYTDARDRVRELADPLEDAIEADPFLGGVALLAQAARGQVEEAAIDESTRQALLTLWVNVHALAG